MMPPLDCVTDDRRFYEQASPLRADEDERRYPRQAVAGCSLGVTEMPSLAVQLRPTRVPRWSTTEHSILPTLSGEGYGLYNSRKSAFLLSSLAHMLVITLLLTSGNYLVTHRHEIRQQVVGIVTDVSPYILPRSASKVGGGGGGGDRDKLRASKGALPRLSHQQLAPPTVVVRNENPRLPVEATVVVPPEIRLPQTGGLGDPLSSVLGPPSNGPGFGGGIGSGSGGGVGSGRGPGVGPGWGGGIGGGAYRVGGGVTAPRVIYAPEPDFSDEARKAKYQGVVVLWPS